MNAATQLLSAVAKPSSVSNGAIHRCGSKSGPQRESARSCQVGSGCFERVPFAIRVPDAHVLEDPRVVAPDRSTDERPTLADVKPAASTPECGKNDRSTPQLVGDGAGVPGRVTDALGRRPFRWRCLRDATDTVGAVSGTVAGVRFGATALPDRWRSSLDHRTELETLTEQLFVLDPVRAPGCGYPIEEVV
jgi:hypothetical protein